MINTVQPLDIQQALDTLRTGGLLLYPTDTIWGIGCDATDPAAVEKVYQLKGRQSDKSFITLLHHENQLESYVADVPEIAYQLIEYTERPLTIVYSSAKNLASNVLATDGSIGIRIVKHPFCERLLQRFRKPILSTSANISGQPAPGNYADISEEIRRGVDYIAEYGREDSAVGKPSVVIKLEAGGRFTFIRK
ncbi:L-threonylcarbamoyladenylate synthase [Parapedobacter lycopersici]|uniref:L-threonylcarbamoyladenylate synthase n=1 Tax=Parapedobacter lycopersici TaxID=1864939 RepID=UPI00214D4C2E|nr:L-threonylcarbamoyladenylate synthase [Parapedobacter lycopersici]